ERSVGGAHPTNKYKSESEHRPHHRVPRGVDEPEAELLADALHLDVLVEDLARDAGEALVAADADQAAEQLGAEALALGGVGDQQGELGVVGAVDLAEAADAEDLAVAGVDVVRLGDQGDLAVVV